MKRDHPEDISGDCHQMASAARLRHRPETEVAVASSRSSCSRNTTKKRNNNPFNHDSPKVFFQKKRTKCRPSFLRKATAVSLAVLLVGWTQCAAAVRSTNSGGGGGGVQSGGGGGASMTNHAAAAAASSINAHHHGDFASDAATAAGGHRGADAGAHHFTPSGGGGRSAFDEEGYWREVKAIIGGVLGFWGGVGGLGTMFLVVVLSQRYCCRKDDDKDDGNEG